MGNVTAHEYDSRDRLTASIDALGNARRRAYDVHGRCVEERDERTDTGTGAGTPLPPRIRRYEPDTEGNVLAVVDALGTRTEQEFDALDRLVRRRVADGTECRYGYDRDGYATVITEASGVIRRIQRDAAGRASRIDVDAGALHPGEALGGETFEEYEYDAHGLARLERNDIAQVLTRRDSLGRPVADELTFLDPASQPRLASSSAATSTTQDCCQPCGTQAAASWNTCATRWAAWRPCDSPPPARATRGTPDPSCRSTC